MVRRFDWSSWSRPWPSRVVQDPQGCWPRHGRCCSRSGPFIALDKLSLPRHPAQEDPATEVVVHERNAFFLNVHIPRVVSFSARRPPIRSRARDSPRCWRTSDEPGRISFGTDILAQLMTTLSDFLLELWLEFSGLLPIRRIIRNWHWFIKKETDRYRRKCEVEPRKDFKKSSSVSDYGENRKHLRFNHYLDSTTKCNNGWMTVWFIHSHFRWKVSESTFKVNKSLLFSCS